MSSKGELQEQLEIVHAELASAEAELEEIKAELSRKVRSAKDKAQKQASQLEEERKKLYAEAETSYTEAVATAKDIYRNYENEDAANLGIVALQVREEVMHALNTVFGDELE